MVTDLDSAGLTEVARYFGRNVATLSNGFGSCRSDRTKTDNFDSVSHGSKSV